MLMDRPRTERTAVVAPPDDDKRWKIIDVTMRRNGYAGHALIETLHAVQSCFGYLEDRSLRYVAMSLQLPLSKVYGVATFYHLFTLKPQGEHTCVICTGTACYIKGSRGLVSAIEARYGVNPGQTTEDNALSVLSARCIGSCGVAPTVVLDGDVLGEQTPDSLIAELQEIV
ncbi:bidirectional hydrogenase complex protein HoxE [Stieleria sp. ICT_E10.1]|uniref:bidirectional hydrogenase complex protein HoxE n=1 Tax=Stieleria sedimenti TaxID=2976331 RepID=UPI00217F5155|nr:bidirectional hydrogenase complex protein HoxE [Stieleria sedimenti]MCS7468645.1 bidirectional hydrogenase complex protein HoxE [Stieleria sedimenti]